MLSQWVREKLAGGTLIQLSFASSQLLNTLIGEYNHNVQNVAFN